MYKEDAQKHLITFCCLLSMRSYNGQHTSRAECSLMQQVSRKTNCARILYAFFILLALQSKNQLENGTKCFVKLALTEALTTRLQILSLDELPCLNFTLILKNRRYRLRLVYDLYLI